MTPAPAATVAVCLILTAAPAWAGAIAPPAASRPAPPAAVAAPPVTAREAPPLRYTVRPGDTLALIEERALADPGDWRALARMNSLDEAAPLVPGSTLIIPDAWLRRQPIEASVVAYSGAVKVSGRRAKLGKPVAAGDVIATGANSFVTLALADGSRVTLPSQSRIKVEALDRIAIDGRLERRFRLETGRSEFQVAPRQQPGDRFLIRTPVAVAAVRGTEFEIETDRDDSIVTVDEGEVSSRPADEDTETVLRPGRAAMVDRHEQRQVAMLPRPALTRESKSVGDTVALVIAPDTAAAHHVVLAHDAGFIDRFAEGETKTLQLTFTEVPDGIVYIRVRGVDADGVEGLGAGYSIVRGAAPESRQTHFRWQSSEPGARHYDLVVARDPALTDRVIDVTSLAVPDYVAEGLPPGVWYWRVTGHPVPGETGRIHVHPVRVLTIVEPRP